MKELNQNEVKGIVGASVKENTTIAVQVCSAGVKSVSNDGFVCK
ncbi:hypothetical protein [Pseudoalteromonas aliena]|uniref:Bacteriocin n=1 Tax=Pseudoalteromonas aliena SW19 TaxID=1314866 RepID=A0ABR9DUS6_9GAMM|nr:hypothetical protein [Pseudoalteromonas aliena]MBE0358109.1 hypothetical protein [Pseudoalteromonas aliena SW19]